MSILKLQLGHNDQYTSQAILQLVHIQSSLQEARAHTVPPPTYQSVYPVIIFYKFNVQKTLLTQEKKDTIPYH